MEEPPDASSELAKPPADPPPLLRRVWRAGLWVLVPFVVIQLLHQVARGLFPDILSVVGEDDAIPIRRWANDLLVYLRNEEVFGLFNFKDDVSRRVSGWLEWPLDLSERLFIRGERIPARGWSDWIRLIALICLPSLAFSLPDRAMRAAATVATAVLSYWLLRDLGLLAIGLTVLALVVPALVLASSERVLKIAAALGVIALTDQLIGTLPWPMIVGLFLLTGLWLGGWRLGLMSGLFIFYLAIFDLWEDSMITLSLVAVAAPIAGLIGWLLGLWGARSKAFEAILSPFLNVLQALPVLSYLLPIAVFIGIGDEAGAVATIIFALAPMARLTMLGLRSVPSEVLEAGRMSGCTKRQMLWKVELPAAMPQLMVGINQVIMQVLAMTVLASFVGTRGLGLPLLNFLQSLKIGNALQVGVAIVLIAVVLDRLSQAFARREPAHVDEGTSPFVRFWYPLAVVVFIGVSLAASRSFDWAQTFPEGWSVDTSAFWDAVVRWPRDGSVFGVRVSDVLGDIRDWSTVELLIPMRDAFQAIPWIGMAALVGAIGFKVGGVRLAAVTVGWTVFLAWSGFWSESMETLYLVVAALILAVLIGIPLGIFAASSDRRTAVMQGVLDTFQVIPSFVYLIPAVMLFSVGAFSSIMAVLIYATVPAVRYTMLGLRNVPHDKIEAALTSGCTPRQALWKVRIPLAFPEIMLGVNQILNFGMLLIIIAAFIGGIGGLGDVILIARTEAALAGESLVAGFCVVAMLQIVDSIVARYSRDRKAQLGID